MTKQAAGAVRCAAVLALAWACTQAWAGTVTVVTSFPKELTQAYKTTFEKANPGIRIEILNKNTVQGMAYIRELPVGQRPDVFWASAPDAFEVLAGQGLLEAIPDLVNKAAPTKVGAYPINPADFKYLGQALAGYGIMWNTRYVAANKLPPPKQWAELVKPLYFGHLAMSSPSRSGTTHLTVETMLQGEGWDKGWSQILQIAGNCAAITERSFGVPDGVNNGQFGIGLVIDFFGLAGKYSGFPVDFHYPDVTAVVPANIGLVVGAKNRDEAKKFISYTVSLEGQQLLYDPKISRLPIMPPESMGGKAPAGYPNPFEIAKRAKVQFNSDLSEARYNVVSAVFDQTITFRLKELQAATKAIHAAEAAMAKKANPKAAQLVKEAREAAYTPVVDTAKVADQAFLAMFAANKKDAAVNKGVTALENHWNTSAKQNYERARSLAEQALVALK
ncbi:MAG: extracellular solute-binding protein [Betaproteobacteria bacterium]|jgi:phosphoglycerate transport regulatory protein PgtC|nr:extracellular solute-binding protein [Betaproteobacteria bacterium]NBT09658.1 extracellular solute-binding protein [Betaproteobacteria bacterium]NBU49316.1 extracellular solute-binding protein [Betaproteobacteria bacterium]NBX95937.1 extracellular solute-binding protein [Betaproteobacteria bacterium]